MIEIDPTQPTQKWEVQVKEIHEVIYTYEVPAQSQAEAILQAEKAHSLQKTYGTTPVPIIHEGKATGQYPTLLAD